MKQIISTFLIGICCLLFSNTTFAQTNKTSSIIIIPDSLLVLDKNPNFTTFKPKEFESCWISSYPGAQLVDVRTEAEYNQGHIANAINIDMKKADFTQKAESLLNKDKPVAVYCKGGIRSRIAAKRLLSKGFMIYNLQNGYDSWLEYVKTK